MRNGFFKQATLCIGLLATLAVSALHAESVAENVFHVRDFGALPDDTADDTAAIRQAIRAAEREGGTVVFEAGTYLCAPQKIEETEIFRIRQGNLTLQGAGMDATVLSCHVYGLRDPNRFFVEKRRGRYRIQSVDTWDNDWEYSHRGHGIVFNPGRRGGTLRNVTIRDLRLSGNARPIDNDAWWSKEERVHYWDISHKGISLGWGPVHLENVRIVNVEVDHFRGELIYKGGNARCDVLIEGCRVHGTPSSAISGPAGRIVGNKFFNYYNAAVETFLTGAQTLVLADNTVEANRDYPHWQPKNGFSIHNEPKAREGSVVIARNTIQGPHRWHVFSYGLSNAVIEGNVFRDLTGPALALRLFGHDKWTLRGHGTNLQIVGNDFFWEGGTGQPALHLHAGGADIDVTFADNTLHGTPSLYLAYDFADPEKDTLTWAPSNRGTGKNGVTGQFWK
ncbi:MAG: glycosyl hydrolase family 28-related protein [Opitutales bacterium]